MSPEKFNSDGQEYDVFLGDVWSLGLTLMELYIGHYPYVQPGQKEADNTALMWEICFEEPPCMPKDASEDFKDFIECCLRKDWTERWTVERLLSHPFIISARQKDVGLGSTIGTKKDNSVLSDSFSVRRIKIYAQYNEVELSALGMAISTVVSVAEILKNNGFAIEKKIMKSTVEIKDEMRGRIITKAKLEIMPGKTDKFEELMAAAAEARAGDDDGQG
ncbi:unnamed protein product [Fraxinus pennsylvanica]|uniref:Protein kinase domain-containing protein n=1 Tax=Fraxinus pennsylvanica TaxID=56036 RepID=A0AAD2A8I3_9LAMI|nr:unnamed protein product [Fraxinus pennsylvanica]